MHIGKLLFDVTRLYGPRGGFAFFSVPRFPAVWLTGGVCQSLSTSVSGTTSCLGTWEPHQMPNLALKEGVSSEGSGPSEPPPWERQPSRSELGGREGNGGAGSVGKWGGREGAGTPQSGLGRKWPILT